ncbi:hypothetical protein J5N97_018876 [Dioscorea zingiberensis]|uniref:Origin recognition complex subunit 3 winged helix C-terminal domain-containing protein n=1 Tax=Dioscorea zingiberensis TaxID=325984 RepID=A0A9D5CDY7_9LILI|nr:hypothetical protein J5N97_018876 [Dioscorea zingiberensis]
MSEIHEKVRELQSIVGSTDGGKILKENRTDIDKSRNYRSEFLHSRKSTLSLNDKAATLLETIIRTLLVPIECIPLHKIICFKHVNVLQSALIGDPRRTIQVDLLKSRAHLQCSCCGSQHNVLSSSMHDTSIMYKLAQDYGDLINLHDWYQSFKATILGARSKSKRKGQSPISKKMNTAPTPSSSMIQSSPYAQQEKTRLCAKGCIWSLASSSSKFCMTIGSFLDFHPCSRTGLVKCTKRSLSNNGNRLFSCSVLYVYANFRLL